MRVLGGTQVPKSLTSQLVVIDNNPAKILDELLDKGQGVLNNGHAPSPQAIQKLQEAKQIAQLAIFFPSLALEENAESAIHLSLQYFAPHLAQYQPP